VLVLSADDIQGAFDVEGHIAGVEIVIGPNIQGSAELIK